MKKYIIFLSLFTISIFGQNYFISSSSGNDNNSGKSDSQPIRTIKKLNTIKLVAGDKVFFKSGDTWIGEALIIKRSGTKNNPITFTNYGNGEKPIITLRTKITSPWVNVAGTNHWYIKTPENFYVPIERVFFQDYNNVFTEGSQAKNRKGNNWDGTSGLTAVRNIWHDRSNGKLYVYSTSNPSTVYKSIEYEGGLLENPIQWGTVQLIDADYITFENFDFQGGAVSVGLAGSDYAVFKNCNIGKYSSRAGIAATWTKLADFASDKTSDYGKIVNCTVDSYWNYDLTFYTAATPYGILIGFGANHWEISNNYIKDWWFGIYTGWNQENNSNVSKYHVIHDNEITAPNFSFCKGIQITASVTSKDLSAYNEVYNNYIHNVKAEGICIASSNNKVYFNTIDGVYLTKCAEKDPTLTNSGFGISTGGEGTLTNAFDNFVFNNTLINLDAQGLRYKVPSVYNNLFLETNRALKTDIVIKNYNFSSGNIARFKNNLFFKSTNNSNTKIFHQTNYSDTKYLSANEVNGMNENIIGNFYSTKSTISQIINADYSLPLGSDAKGAGTDISNLIPIGFKDRFGNIVNAKSPNIGAVAGINSTDATEEIISPSYSRSLSVYLEGAYYNGAMNNILSKDNNLPQQNPYKDIPLNINAQARLNIIPDNYIDWVLVELRNNLTNRKVAKAAIITSEGTIVNPDGSSFSFENIDSGDYYIVIYHKSHLSIMSSKKINVISNQQINYDFTDSQQKAYGENAMASLGDGKYGLYSGDADANGVVNNLDFGVVANKIFSKGYINGDLDMNGIINVLDYNRINKNILKRSQVPK